MQTKEITSYSFFEFCRDAQELILQGYRFDFDSNERYPQSFGTLLVAGLVKQNESMVEQVQSTEAQAEDKPVVKAGRKPKVSAE